MARYGLLIEYDFCTGCHTCEVACKQEHSLPAGKWGVRLTEVEPDKAGEPIYWIPIFTDNCDLCAERIKDKLEPFCVKHCQSRCMKFGPVSELAEFMNKKPKTILWAPR